MTKLYKKSEMAFALVCIGTYCVLQSLANPIRLLVLITLRVPFFVFCKPLFFCALLQKIACRNSMGYANLPFRLGIFFTIFLWLF